MDAGDDPYGWCMGHWFGIAHALNCAGEDIPAEWRYRAGAMGPDVEDWPASQYAEGLDTGEWSADDLRDTGDVLNRYRNRVEYAGLAY